MNKTPLALKIAGTTLGAILLFGMLFQVKDVSFNMILVSLLGISILLISSYIIKYIINTKIFIKFMDILLSSIKWILIIGVIFLLLSWVGLAFAAVSLPTGIIIFLLFMLIFKK